jgi:hypothetical protein
VDGFVNVHLGEGQLVAIQRFDELHSLFRAYQKSCIAQRTEDPGFVATGTNPWMNIRLIFYDTAGGTKRRLTIGSTERWPRMTKSFICPLYASGHTDDADYSHVVVQVITSPTSGGAETLEETFSIYKNVNTCVDEEAVVMFRDRFFQWSFMSFIKKQNTTVNTRPQQAESIDGRFRYNVKADEVLTLNTDWMPDAVNEMFKDLVATEQCYLLAADGSLEALTVEPNSLRLQTSRNDGLHQYQMSFRKSIDNFRA